MCRLAEEALSRGQLRACHRESDSQAWPGVSEELSTNSGMWAPGLLCVASRHDTNAMCSQLDREKLKSTLRNQTYAQWMWLPDNVNRERWGLFLQILVFYTATVLPLYIGFDLGGGLALYVIQDSSHGHMSHCSGVLQHAWQPFRRSGLLD